MPDRLHHPPHLAVTSLVQRDVQDRALRRFVEFDKAQECRRRLTVVELDALHQLLGRLSIDKAPSGYAVELRNVVAGMRHAVREIAVVCEEEKAGAVGVQPADRIDALAYLRDEVQHGALCIRIAGSADDTGRLVQHHVDGRLGCRGEDGISIHADLVVLRIDLHALLAYGNAVDGYSTGSDELFACSARCDACGGEHFL
jgi:hypothetical protein